MKLHKVTRGDNSYTFHTNRGEFRTRVDTEISLPLDRELDLDIAIVTHDGYVIAVLPAKDDEPDWKVT